VSGYNDGKGLRFNIEFIPSDLGTEKRRKNAKPKATNKVVYIHEDFQLRDMLVKVLDALKRLDLLEYSKLYNGQQMVDADSLTITYSIPKTRTKDIALEGNDDFVEMIAQVQAKKNAEGTLVLVENKV
jgi:ferredoxin-fold anticodon binding domain-containing protein